MARDLIDFNEPATQNITFLHMSFRDILQHKMK